MGPGGPQLIKWPNRTPAYVPPKPAPVKRRKILPPALFQKVHARIAKKQFRRALARREKLRNLARLRRKSLLLKSALLQGRKNQAIALRRTAPEYFPRSLVENEDKDKDQYESIKTETQDKPEEVKAEALDLSQFEPPVDETLAKSAEVVANEIANVPTVETVLPVLETELKGIGACSESLTSNAPSKECMESSSRLYKEISKTLRVLQSAIRQPLTNDQALLEQVEIKTPEASDKESAEFLELLYSALEKSQKIESFRAALPQGIFKLLELKEDAFSKNLMIVKLIVEKKGPKEILEFMLQIDTYLAFLAKLTPKAEKSITYVSTKEVASSVVNKDVNDLVKKKISLVGKQEEPEKPAEKREEEKSGENVAQIMNQDIKTDAMKTSTTITGQRIHHAHVDLLPDQNVITNIEKEVAKEVAKDETKSESKYAAGSEHLRKRLQTLLDTDFNDAMSAAMFRQTDQSFVPAEDVPIDAKVTFHIYDPSKEGVTEDASKFVHIHQKKIHRIKDAAHPGLQFVSEIDVAKPLRSVSYGPDITIDSPAQKLSVDGLNDFSIQSIVGDTEENIPETQAISALVSQPSAIVQAVHISGEVQPNCDSTHTIQVHHTSATVQPVSSNVQVHDLDETATEVIPIDEEDYGLPDKEEAIEENIADLKETMDAYRRPYTVGVRTPSAGYIEKINHLSNDIHDEEMTEEQQEFVNQLKANQQVVQPSFQTVVIRPTQPQYTSSSQSLYQLNPAMMTRLQGSVQDTRVVKPGCQGVGCIETIDLLKEPSKATPTTTASQDFEAELKRIRAAKDGNYDFFNKFSKSLGVANYIDKDFDQELTKSHESANSGKLPANDQAAAVQKMNKMIDFFKSGQQNNDVLDHLIKMQAQVAHSSADAKDGYVRTEVSTSPEFRFETDKKRNRSLV